MRLINVPLFIRTIPYLKPQQILYQIWYRIHARILRGLPFALNRIPANIDWAPLSCRTSFLPYRWTNSDEISQGIFRFLNDVAYYGSEINWQTSDKNRLWKYNLHYFQYLHSEGGVDTDVALRLAKHWIDNNPPGTPDAWDPFPISLRVVNWIKYLNCLDLQLDEVEDIIHSIYQQCLWLERSLEYHLLANHIFKNAKALVFSGLLFKGPDAERWLSKGVQLLSRELHEQILPDGGHFERSPMYHSMILEDCLDLLNVCLARSEPLMKEFSEHLQYATRKMIEFLMGITHPDGEIALFNDAAFGIEAQPADLIGYYEKVSGKTAPASKGFGISFPDSGYYILDPHTGNRMLIDCGPIGPEYQTGHSHCDTLSFELSLKGRRVIVDSGCFGYEEGAIRDYNRGNTGHNTLTIDALNQSEVWKSFRCARRAQPLYAKLSKGLDGAIVFEGAHDGYRRLNGGPVHHRRISWSDNTYLIQDRVEGSGRHEVESRLHIQLALEMDDSNKEFIIMNERKVLARISLMEGERIEKIDGWYCPEFGKKERCSVLRTRRKNVSLPYKMGWVIKVEE